MLAVFHAEITSGKPVQSPRQPQNTIITSPQLLASLRAARPPAASPARPAKNPFRDGLAPPIATSTPVQARHPLGAHDPLGSRPRRGQRIIGPAIAGFFRDAQ